VVLRDRLEARRRRVIALLKQQLSLHEIARRMGCHASSVLRWRNALGSSPHDSRALLLQSRIRHCDKLGRMFHSAQAGGLAARSVNILFKDASLPRGLGSGTCLAHSYKEGPAPL
jgi:hypothetical protein